MNKRKIKNSKGITLVALVLTIIVLIILAGISIGALVGDNGVLNQAQQAKIKHEDEGAKEQLELAWSARMSKFYEDLAKGEVSYDRMVDYFNDLPGLNELLGSSGGRLTYIELNEDRNF